ncbi:MAG: excinuclease ABC subunit UvrC [Planctomycetes bacterium]|nr:excinuclease ABC subunit UvrC [Planctomycetota bacterium]
MTRASLADAVEKAPRRSGVYIFRDAEGRALYVGKAKDLKARVRSYLRAEGDGRIVSRYLGTRAHDVEFVVTETEQEALLLEDALVKQLKPPHNVRLRDDKSFLLVKLDRRESFPRFVPVRRHGRRDPQARYFGPYASAGHLRRTLRMLHEIVPLRDCRDAVFKNRTRPCLKHEIGRCSAPCVGLVDAEAYARLVDRAEEILRGKTEEVERELEARMKRAAAELQFETAARVRDQLESLRATTERQVVASAKGVERDAIGLHREAGRVALAVLRFRGGALEAVRSHLLDSEIPDEELVSAFATRLYSGDAFVPREILVPCEPSDASMLAAWLETKRGATVELRVPERGEPRKHLEMANANAAQVFRAQVDVEELADEALAKLAERLELEEVPQVLDCFDISAFQGAAMVASRVRFRGGVPDKAGYRRFRVKSHGGQDDFASMREVVARALRRDLQDADLADLIVIDGGKGQLAAACAARDEVGAAGLALVGLAKARVGRGPLGEEERIFKEGAELPIVLPRGSAERHLLERLRDEAHRFAITYHRQLRDELRSELDEVPGVGPTLRKRLLQHFGSVRRIAAASEQELCALPRITPDLARAILSHLRPPTE